MDEPKRLDHPFFSRLLRGSALFFAVTLTACLLQEPNFFYTNSDTAFVQLAKSVSEQRKLPLTASLKLEIEATETSQTTPNSASTEYYGAVPIAEVASIYKDIGLLGQEVDFAATFAEYQKILRLTAYESATGLVRLSREALQLGRPLETTDPSAARELPAVIGVMQTLQEQHFHWQQKIDSSQFEDHRLALRAVAVGDALLAAVTSRVPTEKHTISTKELELMLQIAAEVDKLSASWPQFFRAQATFPYRQGGQFVSWAYSAKGWQGVNGLYENPPVTTAEVLHPERYFIRQQRPLRFFPAALLRQEKDHALAEQSLGELSVRTLLEFSSSSHTAAETAAKWRGDQLFSFRKNSGIDTFWFSAWESEASAKEFLYGYAESLGARIRQAFDAVQEAKNATLIANGSNGRGWLLQARGRLVLILVSRPGDQLTKLADQAWNGLETEADTTAVHFEIAQRRLNAR